MQDQVTLPRYTCLRCGHTWIPRQNEKPRTCALCRNPYWDRPRKNRVPAPARQRGK